MSTTSYKMACHILPLVKAMKWGGGGMQLHILSPIPSPQFKDGMGLEMVIAF